MFSKSLVVAALWVAAVVAAPAPQVPDNTDAEVPSEEPTSSGEPASIKSEIAPIPTSPPRGDEPGAAYPPIVDGLTGPRPEGPYSGTPTTTFAVTAETTLAPSIAPLPPNPTHTYYNPSGTLLHPAPAPFVPAGGLGTNGTLPRYMVNSDFDFESLALALYYEWIELDLFQNGLATFSEEDFLAAGLTVEDRYLIEFMAEQEIGHATLLTNMLGEAAPVQCFYDYPFTTVREFVDFNSRLTRHGESGVWGFINHLDSREAAQLLAQSIAVEARQQQVFRQMSGLFPMPFWFVAGIPQSWSWTYLAPYIAYCPAGQTRLAWQNFPALQVVNQANINRVDPKETGPYETTGNRTSDPSDSTIPEEESCVNVNVTGINCGPAISRIRTEPLTFPGRAVHLTWENAGQQVGPNNSYTTTTQAGEPRFVAWVQQLNLTYTELTITGPNSGYTHQPASEVFEGQPAVNETTFIALTDTDIFVTPFNISLMNPHVRALGLYQAG